MVKISRKVSEVEEDQLTVNKLLSGEVFLTLFFGSALVSLTLHLTLSPPLSAK